MKRIVYIAFTLWTSLAHAEIQFTRVTDEAGIQFRHFNGATGAKHLPETMGGGAAFFDYDNDDTPDIYFVNGALSPKPQKTCSPQIDSIGTVATAPLLT